MATKKTSTKAEPKASSKSAKRFRLLKNPKQTAAEETYYINGNEAVIVPKEGYHFSLDKEMDDAVAYLKDELGFVEVK